MPEGLKLILKSILPEFTSLNGPWHGIFSQENGRGGGRGGFFQDLGDLKFSPTSGGWGWVGGIPSPLAKNLLIPPPPGKVSPSRLLPPNFYYIPPTLINNFHIITQ